MRLDELFDEGPLDITDEIKQTLMDILTPMVAADVPFVTVKQIIEKLRQLRTGLVIDRIKIIDKIDGNRVYLSNPNSPTRSLKKSDEEKEAEKVDKMATKKATDNLKGKDEL
jgi:hypothetical protein